MDTNKRLDINEPLNCSYAVPTWVRDEQMKLAAKRQISSVEPQPPRPDPIAIVCFGPTLNETWEKIKDFKFVMSCSGAHKFLIEHGIIPNWDVTVDPRPHKVQLIGPPHPDVEYLICSTCHPAVFEHLKDFKVKRWHTVLNEEEHRTTWPTGEWSLTGGSSVGLRCLTMARFFGFTDLHIFGMDGCEGASGKHAAEHPMQPKDYREVEYGGRVWRTTPSMLMCAKETGREIDMLKDIATTFYGDGLVQAMMRDYKPQKPANSTNIAFIRQALISEEYRQLNASLHEDQVAYGVGGGKHAQTVLKIIKGIKTPGGVPVSVLDYGAGKCYLAKELPMPIWCYDPAIPAISESPRPADLVVSTDMLEHIEPDRLDYVLGDLRRCVKQVGYFTIHTGPAVKTLRDGRNAHLIQEGLAWWEKKLAEYFWVCKIWQVGVELYAIVGPQFVKKKAKKKKAG